MSIHSHEDCVSVATIAATGASDIWVTHGQEDALVYWSKLRGLEARPLAIVGYGDEEDEEPAVNVERDDDRGEAGKA